MSKSELRQKIGKILSALEESNRKSQSESLFKRLLSHPKYIEAKRISIYLSTEKEVDTFPILKQALQVDGKQCFIPFVRKTRVDKAETRMVMVELESLKSYEELKLNHFGIKEPTSVDTLAKADPIDIPLDLIIVPGVAFNLDGRRLGHGKGYYDEFLFDWARRSPNGRAYTIGLALKEQLVENPLADDKTDYRLDEIL